MCGPRGLPGGDNLLFHNNGNGTFTDVSEKAGILKPGPRYSITSVSYDFDNDGWPDIYVAVDSQPSILFKNNHDGTLYRHRSHWPAALTATMATNRLAWELRLPITIAMAGSISSKPILPTTPCNLYHNNGDGTFSDLTFASGVGVNSRYVCVGLRFCRLR